ncbi:selenocysteine synthase [Campylobacter iguaniorum]|uniref:L-seryl-tRNA(Sec) selenium transferase n=1 Tax=Campylobacter iguaniorum TaxID=1244531 RepID=UPI0007C93DAE|nr:L-seryl-tRNA(Sec) selenium transferase [Campylobacter iguaniorum]ANE36437.1 selenocysteine synthase [Campylobacter iguaniorum]
MQVKLPKIDKIPKLEIFKNCFVPALLQISKDVINEARETKKQILEDEIIKLIKAEYDKFDALKTKPLINATGVVIHTNLGRSPLKAEIFEKILPQICSYSNLEYSTNGGKRGDRYAYTSTLLKLLSGCEDALVVNNNAAAVFLVLNTFAKGKEVIVSRGELVEIGGSFRVPEVMSASGGILKEIGTTNKTHLKDYENAINENSKMILKVHKSNYDIVGFSSEVGIDFISNLAHEKELLSYYDLGSGYAGELPFSLGKDEPNIKKILQSGVDLVSFSGDKLFGSVQCGIILGKKELIAKLKSNQLLRMLRVDKITLGVLNETLKAYLNKEFNKIAIMEQIYKSTDELENMAKTVKNSISLPCEIVHSTTILGGGTMPNKHYPTIALSFSGNANQNETKFRQAGIIGRIENDEFMLDFRSILSSDLPNLISILKAMHD